MRKYHKNIEVRVHIYVYNLAKFDDTITNKYVLKSSGCFLSNGIKIMLISCLCEKQLTFKLRKVGPAKSSKIEMPGFRKSGTKVPSTPYISLHF